MEENGFYDKIESQENKLAQQLIGAAIEVHRTLGPGLLEHPYEECLCYELTSRKMPFTRQVGIPLTYKGERLECGFRADLIVGNKIVVEVKSVAAINDIHLAQMITYLKLTRLKLGLILNFNTITMKSGIKRVVLNL